MSRSRTVLLASLPLAVVLAGCFHFDSLPPDGGGGGGGDLASAGGDGGGGGPSTDGGGGKMGDGGGPQPGECPRPWLLQLVGSADSSYHARVVHYSIAGGKLTRCDSPSFDLGGTLPSWPNALAFIPGAEVIAIGDDGATYLVDAATGGPRGSPYKESEPQGQPLPRDIFALDDNGTTRIAILYSDPYATELSGWADHIEVIDDRANKVVSWMFAPSQSPLHSISLDVVAMTASPYEASQMLYRCFGDTNEEAITIDAPFDGKPRLPNKPGLWGMLPGGVGVQIYSPGVPQGAWHTPGWVWTTNGGFNGDPAKVYRANDSGAGPALIGPLDCAAHCPQPSSFQHAVPDPTDDNAVFAMCDDGHDVAALVRMTVAGACDVLDEAKSYTLAHPRFQQLAIAP